MNQWLYIVWSRDYNLPPEDQDHEWPACIVIKANLSNDVLDRVDILSKKYCSTNAILLFLRSEIEKFITEPGIGISNLPFIKYGYLASDSEIGW